MEEQRARKKQRKLLAAAEDHNEEYDLLSSLPEPLIHHVLSLLSLKDIVKAAAVCKSWGRTFASFPVLNFRCGDFLKTGEENNRRTIWERFKSMSRLVDATMTRFREQHLKIDKFEIDYPYFGELTGDCLSRIDKWIAVALDNNAQEIHIALTCWESEGHDKRTVPEPPSLDLVALPSSTTSLKSLRSLTLAGFKAGEFLLWGRLISAFGSLESLSLSHCRLEEVRISGLPNLKTVSITDCTSTRLVDIEAPTLESFKFDDYCGVSTHPPCVVNVNHSPNLKSLTLHYVGQNDDWFRDFLSRFQRLRDLTMLCCYLLTRIRISSPSIEDIEITRCYKLTNISIEAPDLRRFRLNTINGLLPSIRMKDPPRRNPVAEVTVSFREQVETKPGRWSHELREFLAGSCKSFSSLSFCAYGQDYDLKLRKDIKSRWLGVIACGSQQLYSARCLATWERLPRAVDGTDVNGLIWTPHPATVSAVAGLSEDDFLQLFYNKVAGTKRCRSYYCTSYTDGRNIEIFTGSNK